MGVNCVKFNVHNVSNMSKADPTCHHAYTTCHHEPDHMTFDRGCDIMHGLFYTLEGLCGLCLTQWCTWSHTALLELYMENRLTFPQMSGVFGMSQ